jgi:hypothetical protein
MQDILMCMMFAVYSVVRRGNQPWAWTLGGQTQQPGIFPSFVAISSTIITTSTKTITLSDRWSGRLRLSVISY